MAYASGCGMCVGQEVFEQHAEESRANSRPKMKRPGVVLYTGSPHTLQKQLCPSRKKALGIRAAFERPDTSKVCRPEKEGSRGGVRNGEALIRLQEQIRASRGLYLCMASQVSKRVEDT